MGTHTGRLSRDQIDHTSGRELSIASYGQIRLRIRSDDELADQIGRQSRGVARVHRCAFRAEGFRALQQRRTRDGRIMRGRAHGRNGASYGHGYGIQCVDDQTIIANI